MTFIRPGRDNPGSAPTVLGTALIADNEDEGVDVRTLTYTGITAAGLTILTWVGILTADFAGPPTGNNGNTYTQRLSETYGPTYTAWSLRCYSSYNIAGGSDHTTTVDKDTGTIHELTFASIVLSGGTIVSSSTVNRVAAGAGAAHTSGSVTVTGPALLVAAASGTGDPNPTNPTQTWPVEWTVRESVARNSSQDASGHIPFYLGTRLVGAGTYTLQVQVTIDEGLVMQLLAIQ